MVLAAGLLAWIVNAAILLGMATPLGHDEAQYAIAAQDLIDDRPTRWLYLSIGTNLIALPGVLAGGSAGAIRFLPALLGLAFLLAAHRFARNTTSGATAAWVVAVLAGSVAVAKRAADLLSDMPAAALLLGGALVVITEVMREGGPRWRLVLSAPLLAAAFYVRYGSVLAIAAIAGVAVLVGWRAILQRPLRAAATIAAFALLLLPHFLAAHAATGSPLGILRESSSVLGSSYPGESLVTYATSNPFKYYGLVTTPVLLAGLAAIRRARDRRVLALWLLAVADLVVVGLTPVPQARYIYFAIVILVTLGVDELRRWIAASPPAWRRVLGGIAAGAVAVSWLTVAVGLVRLVSVRRHRDEPMLVASAAIRADARGAPCQVLGRNTTQLQWYSGCVSILDVTPEAVASERVYLVRQYHRAEQPDPARNPGVPALVLDRPGLVAVYRMDPR